MTLPRRIGLWAPVVVFMVATWLVTDTSDLPVPAELSDTVLHAVAYALFGLFCLRAFHGGLTPPTARASLPAMLLAVGYGAVDEVHQRFVPGRVASVGDWIADATGAGLALAGVALWFSWRSRTAARRGKIDDNPVREVPTE